MLLEKLLSGKLRKHSEQLNKFVAGFFDTDGSVMVALDKKWFRVTSKITQASSKDPDFEVMRALQKHYNLGYLTFTIPKMENSAGCCDWVMGIKDSRKFFNLIGKHLLVKYNYFVECLWIYEELKETPITKEAYLEIKEYCTCYRRNSKFPRIPKHLSFSYTAGIISGDGHWRCSQKENINELNVEIVSTSLELIESFVRSYKGTYRLQKPGLYKWRRNLGKQSANFSKEFLPKIRKYTILKTKRDVIDRMLKFHKLPAETKQDDLHGN